MGRTVRPTMATGNGPHLARDNGSAPPQAWLGVNFWSRAGGPRMWARYDAGVVRDELAVLAEHGLQRHAVVLLLARLRAGARDARRGGPGPVRRLPRRARRGRPRHDPDVHRRPHVRRELGSAVAPGPRSLPRRLARRAAGVVRRRDRAALRRAPGRRRLARLERDAALRRPGDERRDHRVGAHPSSRRCARRARRSRSRSATAPGASRSRGTTTATRCGALAPLVDFVGPHVYPMQDDEVRQLLTAAFACELSGGFGKPVVLEEFGVSSDFASDEHAADYYRQVLYTTLLAGRARLDRLEQLRLRRPSRPGPVPPPRLRDPLRPHRSSRAAEAAAARARAASPSSCASSADEGWEPVKGDAAIVVPEHFERVLPFTSPAYRQDIRDNLLQSYVAAREADLPVALRARARRHPRRRRVSTSPRARSC